MLQPPPFLGSPPLDLLHFVSGGTDTGHSNLVVVASPVPSRGEEWPPSVSWHTSAAHYVATTARRIHNSRSKHS